MANDEAIELTVKGFLAVETGLYKDIDRIWENLTKFVVKKAAENGMSEGVPCLVLADGGHCITATRQDG